jgi:LL-diaminopimelate aminotransferase
LKSPQEKIAMPKSARRLDNLPPYAFAALGRKLATMRGEGKDVIGLHIGSPDLPPPDHVVDALNHAAHDPAKHGYAGFTGTPGLREAIAGYYDERFGVQLDPSTEVLPLIGSKEGIAHMALAYLDAGDVALVPDPGYPTYGMGTVLAGGEPHTFGLSSGNGFMPVLEDLPADVLGRTRIMWVNYPNNPTGAAASLDDLAAMVEFAREHDILLCSDNPYADVTFDGYRAHSILEVDGAKDVAVEFNSLSKTYNMAGWRVGMCVGSAEALKALLAVKSNVDSGLFRAVCDASEEAIRGTSREWIEQRNVVYQERRDLIVDALPSIGLSALKPKGALYIWAKVEDGDDQAYADSALDGVYVCMTPGSVYGQNGAGYVRFSLVTPKERLSEAIERLQGWYSSRS